MGDPIVSAGPACELQAQVVGAASAIESWFSRQWQENKPPFYCSVDLRRSGLKLAPIDTNLFPGGFNNLAETSLPSAVQAARAAIERHFPNIRRLLVIPERHTRNTYYLQNVARLVDILRKAGLLVRVGSLSEDLTAAQEFELPDGNILTMDPLERSSDGGLRLKDFDQCPILLNNDLSAGIPAILTNLGEQATPPLHAGWALRRKTNHFTAYDSVAVEFARLLDIDPWLINPFFAKCSGINFHDRATEDRLAETVDEVLAKTAGKYREYGIAQEPYVVVKADAGTYGMGLMTVRDAKEVKGLNRRQRNKMAVVKEGMEVSDVIVQEGIPTQDQVNDSVAEPVLYMIDSRVIGGFYRVNPQRGDRDNLNSIGAQFTPMAFAPEEANPDANSGGFEPRSGDVYTLSVIARLAMLAASLEISNTDPSAGSR